MLLMLYVLHSRMQDIGISTALGKIICFYLSFIADSGIRAYGNETEVGEGIRASGVPRSEIFVRKEAFLPRLTQY
jgi:hypothetical protein